METGNNITKDIDVNINFKLEDLLDKDSFLEYISNFSYNETLISILTKFYALKLGQYINDADYESIVKLEGIAELTGIISNFKKD